MGSTVAPYVLVFRYDEEGRLVKIERDYGGGEVRLSYEVRYNSDGGKVWDREWLWETENAPQTLQYRYVCRIGCGGVPMRVYWWESGSWQDYEWYTPHLRGTWYEGYELFGMLSWWLNMDYPLLSGHLLVADDWLGIPWMVQLMYDRFGVYVGQRFYPAEVKREPHYLKQYPDEPPPILLPKVEPPFRIPELPENPIPGLPNPTGPINVITGFCNGARTGSAVSDAGRICNEFLQTERGMDWCFGESGCPDGNLDCCRFRCIRELQGLDPSEPIRDFLCAYQKVWENL